MVLMQGGGEADRITPWRAEVQRRLSDPRDQADLGLLTLTLAGLAARRAAWQLGLKGWNMQTASLWDEKGANHGHKTQARKATAR
jgi:hypothetical protein